MRARTREQTQEQIEGAVVSQVDRSRPVARETGRRRLSDERLRWWFQQLHKAVEEA